MMNRYRKKHLLFIMLVAIGFILANSNYQFQLEVIPAGTWETVDRFDSGNPSTYGFWDNEDDSLEILGTQSQFVTAALGDDYVDATQSTTYGTITDAPPSGMGIDNDESGSGPTAATDLIEAGYVVYSYTTKTSYTGGSKPAGWLDTYITWDTYEAKGPSGNDYSFGSVGYTTQHDMTSYGATRIRWSWKNAGGDSTELGDLKLHYYAGGGYSTVWSSPAGYNAGYDAESYTGSASSDVKVRWYMSGLSGSGLTWEQFYLDNLYLEGRTSNTYYRFQAVFRFDTVDYAWDKATLYIDFVVGGGGTTAEDLDFYIEAGDTTPDHLIANDKDTDFNVDVSAYITGATVYLDIRDDYRTGDTVQSTVAINRCYLKLENTAPINDGTPTVLTLDDTDNFYARYRKYEVTTYHKDVDGFGDINYVQFYVYNDARTILYFYAKFIQSTHVFSEGTTNPTWFELDTAGSTYSEHDVDELDVTWKFWIEWECDELTDMDVRSYVIDTNSLSASNYYETVWDIETRLDWSSVPAVTDDDAGTIDRGDLDESFTMQGTLKYYGGTLPPQDADVDVWVSASEYGTNVGPWSDLLGSSGTYSVTCYADDVAGQDTYTMKPVKNGAGSGGSSLYYTTDLTDTYTADQIEIIWFVASDYRINIGTAIEIRVKAIYDSDDTEVSTGTITLNGTYSMTWDSGNSWFDYTTSAYSTVGARCFNITDVADVTHGITGWIWGVGSNPSVDNHYLRHNNLTIYQIQEFTIELWYMAEDLSDFDVSGINSGQVGFRNYRGGTGYGGFLIPYRNSGDPDGLLRFYAIYNRTTGGQTSTYKQYTDFEAWRWYHFVYVAHSDGQQELYQDGVLRDSWKPSDFEEWTYINVYGLLLHGWGNEAMSHVDELRFYSRAYTASDAYEAYHGIHSASDLVSHYKLEGNDILDDAAGSQDLYHQGSADKRATGVPVSVVWDAMMVSYSLDESREDVGSALRATAAISYAFDSHAVAGLTTTWSPSATPTDVGDGTYYVDYTKNYVYKQDTYLSTISGDTFGISTIGIWDWDGTIADYFYNSAVSESSVTAFTYTFWLRSSDNTYAGSTISCSDGTQHNEILLYNYNNFAPHIAGSSYGATSLDATDGTWNHWVWQWQSSDGVHKFYKNGILVLTSTPHQQGTTLQIENIVIGQEQDAFGGGFDAGQAVDGEMADIRLYLTYLDAHAVYAIYQRHYGFDSSLLIAWDLSNTDVNDAVVDDASANNLDATIYGITTIAKTSNLRAWPIWDALAFDIYIDNDRYDLSTEDVTITCKAIYAYDGTTFTDAGGSTLTFLTFGAATYSGGLWTDSGANGYIALGNYYVSAFTDGVYGLTKITSGFYFAGTDDRLEIPHDSSQTAISDFTIEGWFYPTSSAESKVIVAKAYGASRQFMVWWLDTSQIAFVYKNTTYFNIGCSPTGLALNTWHHFVITIDGSTNLNAWYDGIHYREDYTMAESLIQRDVVILIGCREYSGGVYDKDFIGYISHLRMYSRALADDECYAHYQRHYESDTDLVFALTGSGLRGNAGTYGQWIDSTANNNDATAYNGAAMFQNSGGDKRIRPIWDTVSWEIWVDAGRVNAGVDTVRVWFDAVYAYDGAAFEGSVTIEGNAMTPSGGAWYYDIPAQSVGQYTWDTIDITDSRFGLNDEHAILYFDGSNDYATIVDSAALNTNQDYSVSVWFYYSGDGAAGKIYWTIAAKNNVGQGYLDSWHFYVQQTTHYLKCRVGGGSSGQSYDLGSGVDVYDSNWHMATLTYDHSERQFKLFLDGYLKQTYDAAWDCVDNADVIRLGSWNGYGDYYKGYISEILHWSRTLADEEVFLLYTGQYSTTNLEMRIDGLSFQYKETYEMADRIASHDLNTVGPRIHDLSSVEKALPVWDEIEVYYGATSDGRTNVGEQEYPYFRLRLKFDNHLLDDSTNDLVYINSSIATWGVGGTAWYHYYTQTTVGSWNFIVTSASENTYGITAFDSSSATTYDIDIIWDAIGNHLWIEDGRGDVDCTITVYAWLAYLYDGTNVTDGTVLLNGTGMSYSSQVWSLGRSQSTVGLWSYNITSVSGNTHGITIVGLKNFTGSGTDAIDVPNYEWDGSSTISFWFNTNTIGTKYVHFCGAHEADEYIAYHISSERFYGETDVNNEYFWLDPIDPLLNNTWYHAVFVKTGDGYIHLYLDGVWQDSDNAWVSDGFTLSYFGKGHSDDAWDYEGYLTDFRFYDRALSSHNIMELYQGAYSNTTDLFLWYPTTGIDYSTSTWKNYGSGADATIEDPDTIVAPPITDTYVRPIWDQIEMTYFIGDSFGYNFDFELGTLEGWTIQAGSPYITSAASHGDVIHFDGDGTYHRVISDGLIPCSEGDVFKAELWYNASSGSLGYFGMYFVGVGWQYFFTYPSMTRDGTWYYKSGVSVAAPAGATYAQVWLFNYVGNTGALEYDDIYIWSDDVAMRCSTSDTATYHAKARLDYDNHDLGAGDSFTIDGISFTWDSDLELFTGTASSGTVQAIIYDTFDVGSEATYGITVGTMAGFNITQIYDELVFDIQADDESPDTGVTVTFTITVTFAYDSSTCSYWNVTIQRDANTGWGTFNWLSTIQDMESTPQSHDYLAYSAWEMAFNINDIDTTNTETVTWYNQYPVNVSLSVDYDDTDNCYARYRYYLITFTVSDGDGYGNIQTVQIALFESTRTTMYWAVNYTQATDTFTEAYGGSKIVLADWSYDDSSGNQIILYIYIKVEWAHGELTDADFRGYVIDDVAESDLDWYDENAEIVCTLDYTVTPTVTDAVADATRGDISGSLTGAGTVIYYGSGDNYPLANETDVWILHDVSGTWSDDVDGSGAFSKAMTADSSVRESTYTIKVVIQGAGSGGTDLYYTTSVTDTYISDSLTITITDPTDPEQRLDLNVNATGIVVSAVYDYDSATYDGTLVLNSTTFSYATVGKRGYTVSSASGDDSFGITAISTNDDTYCIWDEMIVLYILADDDVSYLGLSVNFTVGLQYKYDSDNVQTGTFSLEALALAFSAGANWTVSDSHGTSGTWLYNDVTGTDGAYSLTGIDMDSNTLSVVWDTIVISASFNYDWTLIGYNLTITTTGTFEHLGYTWNGTPTWSGTDYPEESTIGNYTYTLNSITEPDYGVTTFTNDPTLWAIFDTVNCSRSALYWKNTLDADWLYLDTAAFFFGFNESGLTENFKIQSYYGYPDASTSSDYAYVNNHSQIDRLIIGNFSGAGMDTINASYSAVCTILGEPEYRIWSYDMSYLDVRNVVYEDTVFVDAGARAYILNNEEVRNQIHIVLYNNSMIAGSYAEDGTSIWVRILAYRDAGFPSKQQIWSSTKSLSTNTGGTVVWSLRNWDAWNICNKWNTATSPFIYIHYSTVSSSGPWTFINAFHALGSNYNLDPYNDATWTVDLERSQVLVESDWSPDRENLTAWMEEDGLTPYGYGEFAHYEWINAENWNRYVWEALVTIWADFGAPIGGPAPNGEFQYVRDRRPIDPIPLGVILFPLTGWQVASGIDDISYFWLDVFPQWAFWYEEDGQWYRTGDYDISLWLRTRLENNILWSPWYQKLADPNNYETGQHFQENLVQPFDYRDTELSIAGERVALSGDITFSFDYIIYENDVNVGTGSVNITPTLNVWSQFAIYWDRQQGTGNVNYSIYCNTTAYEEWSSQSLWINGTYSKAELPSGFTIEQFEVEYDDVYVNIYCETNWANSTLYLYVDGSLKATSAEADIIQYRKSMTEGTHSLNILIDAGSETRWRNYTYAIGVDAITLKIIEFEWDTGSPNTYSCFVRTNWGNATVRLLEDGNTRFIQTEIGKGMSFKLSKVQRIGVHTVTLQIDAGGQILTYVLGYSYREPDHPSDTPDVGPVLSVIGDELSDSIEGKVVLHPALVGFFLSTAFMAVIILIIVFKWLLKEPIL